MMNNAVWELLERRDSGGRPDDEWLTTSITVAKAVQD
jgi:hypothetical protein